MTKMNWEKSKRSGVRNDTVTAAQRGFIKSLARELGVKPKTVSTRTQATQEIQRLLNKKEGKIKSKKNRPSAVPINGRKDSSSAEKKV